MTDGISPDADERVVFVWRLARAYVSAQNLITESRGGYEGLDGELAAVTARVAVLFGPDPEPGRRDPWGEYPLT
jgi:hypothetical protein